MSKGIVNKKPLPIAKKDIADPKVIEAKPELWKGFFLSYRTCYYCKTIYNSVNSSLNCEYWHEGTVDAAGNKVVS